MVIDSVYNMMDKEKEKEAKKRFEEMKRKAEAEENKDEKQETDQKVIPREAFRKNLGCGG